MAREQLDVTTVIFSNRRYAILRMELARVGATASGARALEMLDISPPEIDFVALARGFLDDPHWAWHAAETLGAKVPVPPQYARATVETWPGAKIVRPPKQAEAAPPR